jgi:hypothetical protein
MLETLLQRLFDLLMQGRIDYPDLQAIIDDLPQLSDAELDGLIMRIAAIHRLLLALKGKRLTETSASDAPAEPEVR